MHTLAGGRVFGVGIELGYYLQRFRRELAVIVDAIVRVYAQVGRRDSKPRRPSRICPAQPELLQTSPKWRIVRLGSARCFGLIGIFLNFEGRLSSGSSLKPTH